MFNLYVHVPFCASKCRYCVFYSQIASIDPAFGELAAKELSLRGHSQSHPDTIYIGGGTPSLLGADGLRELFSSLPEPALGAETTVEVNPADVTLELAKTLKECGVTRVSIGAQSFNDKTLQWLGRRHTAEDTVRAATLIRDAGIEALSLDLICAIPDETQESLERSIRSAIALSPNHVSVYSLSVEEGSGLEKAGIRPASPDCALSDIALASRLLGAAGFCRYEISNWARSGFECRHNLAVWNGEDYTGVGPGAWSREGLMRRGNAKDFDSWKAAITRGQLPPAETICVEQEDDEAERFLTQIRLYRWQSPDPATQSGQRRLNILRSLEKNGIVRSYPDASWSLTERGLEVVDSVMAELR